MDVPDDLQRVAGRLHHKQNGPALRKMCNVSGSRSPVARFKLVSCRVAMQAGRTEDWEEQVPYLHARPCSAAGKPERTRPR